MASGDQARRYEQLAERLAVAGDRIRWRALRLAERAARARQQAEGLPAGSEDRFVCEWRAREWAAQAEEFMSYAEWHASMVEEVLQKVGQLGGGSPPVLKYTPVEIEALLRRRVNGKAGGPIRVTVR